MRLTKGSKVEVLSRKEVSMGAWLCAEIISGNGHTYSVRYDGFRMTSEAVVERVPRKALRPCPPPVIGADNWVPGDLVEVFHNQSWKTAAVVKLIGGVNNFSVRLLESSEEFRVQGSHLRVRQCWRDGNWFVVGRAGDDCFQNPDMVFTRTLKRGSPLGSSDVEENAVAAKKMRLIEKDGRCQRMCFPSPTSEKVDAFVSPHEILGENYMHSPFIIKITGFSKMDTGRGNDSYLVGSPNSVGTVSPASSVDSCSAFGDDFCNLSYDSITHHSNDLEDYSSDAESSSEGRYEEEECSVPTNEELGTEVHRSELHAYRSNLEALYASGPLSWEEEANMTNLRLRLHISDDEHSIMIKNLISADTRLSARCY